MTDPYQRPHPTLADTSILAGLSNRLAVRPDMTVAGLPAAELLRHARAYQPILAAQGLHEFCAVVAAIHHTHALNGLPCPSPAYVGHVLAALLDQGTHYAHTA